MSVRIGLVSTGVSLKAKARHHLPVSITASVSSRTNKLRLDITLPTAVSLSPNKLYAKKKKIKQHLKMKKKPWFLFQIYLNGYHHSTTKLIH